MKSEAKGELTLNECVARARELHGHISLSSHRGVYRVRGTAGVVAEGKSLYAVVKEAAGL